MNQWLRMATTGVALVVGSACTSSEGTSPVPTSASTSTLTSTAAIAEPWDQLRADAAADLIGGSLDDVGPWVEAHPDVNGVLLYRQTSDGLFEAYPDPDRADLLNFDPWRMRVVIDDLETIVEVSWS